MNQSFISAAKKAEQLRMQLSLDSFQPVNIFDICQKLNVTVRFIDINMEGMYVSQTSGKFPTILLSSLRPLARRVYTCAHELGHHLFEHGSRMDMLADHTPGGSSYNHEERLVDTFAGLLLMPIASVIAEFNRRKWKLETVSQLDFFKISCFFGVGYQSLVGHCKANHLITEATVAGLLKTSPSKLLSSIRGHKLSSAPFKIFDGISMPSTIDIETGSYIFLPKDTLVEGNHLQKIDSCTHGIIYLAKQPGVLRLSSDEFNFGCFLRIQNINYIGLAENRHLENDLD